MDFPRWIRGVGKLSQRRLRPKPKTFLRKFFSSHLMQWDRVSVARGVAIGMFWAAIPMPFQMAPATVFCLLFRGNLPLAIACVWLSNPLTYVPMLAFEYAIGKFLLGIPGEGTQLEGNGTAWEIFRTHLHELGIPILVGGLALGIAASVAGYLVTYFLWKDRLKAGLRRAIARRTKRAAPDEAS